MKALIRGHLFLSLLTLNINQWFYSKFKEERKFRFEICLSEIDQNKWGEEVGWVMVMFLYLFAPVVCICLYFLVPTHFAFASPEFPEYHLVGDKI